MHLLNKINIHHLLFAILGILLIGFYPDQSPDEVYYLGIHPLILLIFIAITTIGLGHGALDGKIVWELSIKKKISISNIFNLSNHCFSFNFDLDSLSNYRIIYFIFDVYISLR